MNALLFVALLVPAAPGGQPASPRPLSLDLNKWQWVPQGSKKLPVDEVVTRLGAPDRHEHTDFTRPLGAAADAQLVWEDLAQVEVRYDEQNKMVAILARYNGTPTLWGPHLLPENVLKLRPGMTNREVWNHLRSPNMNIGRTDQTQVFVQKLKVMISVRGEKYDKYDVLRYGDADPKKAAPAPVTERPKLTRELAEAIEKGKLKTTELLKKLGRPDRIEQPHDGSRGP
jgi:hypothetical protein